MTLLTWKTLSFVLGILFGVILFFKVMGGGYRSDIFDFYASILTAFILWRMARFFSLHVRGEENNPDW